MLTNHGIINNKHTDKIPNEIQETGGQIVNNIEWSVNKSLIVNKGLINNQEIFNKEYAYFSDFFLRNVY